MSQAPTTVSVPDEAELGSSVLVYGSFALVCLVVYLVLIKSNKLKWWLEPKEGRFSDVFSYSGFRGGGLSEYGFIERCGMDAYLSLRGIYLMFSLSCMFSIFGCAILLPMYHTSQMTPKCQSFCNDFRFNDTNYKYCVCSWLERSSFAGVHKNEHFLLWLSVLGLVFCTAVTLWFLQTEYKHVVKLRGLYWRSNPPQLYTVLIDDIPSHLDFNSTTTVADHFDKLFPGQVYKVEPVKFRDPLLLHQLRRAGNHRMKVFDKLNELQALMGQYPHKFPKYHSCCINSCTVRDPNAYLSQLQNDFEIANDHYEELARGYNLMNQDVVSLPLVAAFITFRSAKVAAVATQAIVDQRYNVVLEGAPEPADVRWTSPGAGLKWRVWRTVSARVGMFALIVIWAAFVSFVGAMTSAAGIKDAFQDSFPAIPEFLDDHPALVDFLDRISPLVLSSLLSIVNPLICLLARWESRVSESNSQRVATVWNFWFLVIQVFLVYGISSSVLQTLTEILNNPPMIISVLSAKIPFIASFYMEFIVTKFVTSLVMDLFRVSSLTTHSIRILFFGRSFTSRDKERSRCGMDWIETPPHVNLSALNSQMLLIFFVVTCYAVIQPLILPLAALFFGCAYLTYIKIFSTVAMQRYDSGGNMWPTFYWCYCSSILAAQLTLLGLLGLKEAATASSVVLLLFPCTIFAMYQIDFRYRRLVLEIPLDIASQIDEFTDSSTVEICPSSALQYDVLTQHQPNYVMHPLYNPLLEDASKKPVRVYSYELPVAREKSRLLNTSNSEYTLERPLLQ